jgi:predicted ATPase/DNA-binding XRE family transcriptional regulator
MAHDSFQTFGELLTYLRKRARLTQAELARAVGYSREQIVRLEKNQRVPDRAVIAAVFIPALDLDGTPELAQRLLDLASRTRQPHTNLPAQLTSFIGREADVAAVRDYLLASAKRLITLIGPPGIGKTRLSLQVAQALLPDFADGVFFVPLAALTDVSLVAPTVAHALGFPEVSGVRPEERVIAGIGQRRMLIVLDNFEHLTDAAPLTAEFLIACPNLKIMVTSRESLRVPGEWLYPVPPLSIPDAAQLKVLSEPAADQFSALTLFTERARAVRPDFALTRDNTSTVAAICRQLDGLPLAIELIASRLRLMSPQALSANLTSEFKLHADGMRGVPARQKTLHNAIAWSYDRLSHEEQVLFARLAVFAGGFTLDAAQAIVQLPNVIKGVMSLLDKSLLVRTIDAQGDTRFNQLEMIRDFAREKLDESGETERLRQRHRDFFIAFSEQAGRKLKGVEQFAWLDRLEIEHDNWHAAWEFAIERDAKLALRLAAPLLDFWLMRGNLSEGRARLAQLLERANQWGRTPELASALSMAGYIACLQQDFPAARSLLEQALNIARTVGDQKESAFALLWLGWTALCQHDNRAAQLFMEESMAISQELQDECGTAVAIFFLGGVAAAQGCCAEAEERYMQSLAKFRELGDKFRAGPPLNSLGELARLQGDYERAGQYYKEAVEILREHRSYFTLATALLNLAWVSLHRGDYQKAQTLFGESLELSIEHDNKTAILDCLAGFAAVLGIIAKAEEAARLFGAVESLLDSIEMRGYRAPADQVEFDHYLAVVRAQLDEATFTSAWAEGRAMTPQQAIELALTGFGR